MIALLLLIRERVGRPARQIQIGERHGHPGRRRRGAAGDDPVLRPGPPRDHGRGDGRRVRPVTGPGLRHPPARAGSDEQAARRYLPVPRDGDRLRFSTLRAEAGFNDSRFTAVSTIVAELGLAGGLQSVDHALTAAGASLLTTGDLPERPLTGAGDRGEQA